MTTVGRRETPQEKVASRETPQTNTIQYSVRTWENNTTSFYLRESMGLGLRYVQRDQVPLTNWSMEMLGDLQELIETHDGPDQNGMEAAVIRHSDRHMTLVHVFNGWAAIRSASDDLARSQAACAEVADRIRTHDDQSETQIAFWALNSEKHPNVIRRKLATPRWNEVSENYSPSAQAAFEQLLTLKDCPNERMILWHGPPGTGKTYALRALAREWRAWCDVSFITDPDRFVGGSPTYLFQVANFRDYRSARSAKEHARRSKLLICEDAGGLMTPEARATTGQGLSRLLNLTDGLLGQGFKTMVLITTNEPISSLHPAVVRPGRCLQETEFPPLSADRANQWLRRHGVTTSVDKPTTLAELYALVAGRIPQRSDSPRS